MDVFRKAAAMRSSVAETNPTSVYLVSCDHKGAKLLFRYPFHALEEPVRTMSVMDRKRSLHRDADTVSDRQKTQNLAPLTDDVVANLLAVNDRMCGRKFELTVKDVRFVGHPMLIQTGGFCDKKKRVKSPILIHIVFALNASARHQVVDCYYELSKALAIALGHEENRCVYLTSQVRHMVNIHDTVIEKCYDNDSVIENCLKGYQHYEKILKSCRLAKDLKKVFEDVCSNGVIKLKVNNWVEVSVCLPHKVHHFYKEDMYFEPESINKCLIGLRPYHGLLLLADRKVLLDKLSQDSSPSIVRLINMYNPVKSLQTLSADSDLTLAQVFNIAGHLIYWGDAIAIFPLSENNLYAVAPNVPTQRNNEIAKKFQEKFPEHNLFEIMSEFSFPTSMQYKMCAVEDRSSNSTMIQILIWLLQHKILLQYHMYIYFMPSDRALGYYNVPKSRGPNTDKLSDVPMTTYQTSTNWQQRSSRRSNSYVASAEQVFRGLDVADQTALMNIMKSSENSANPDDLRLLLSLLKNGYLSGQHHVEEIMFLENIRRSELLQLLEKFKQVLVTIEMEDPVISNFYSH